MGDHCPWIVPAGLHAYEWEPIATLGDCTEDGPSPRSKAFKRVQADACLIAAAPDLLEALEWINGEAPAKEPRDGPTVGFQPSQDPEEDDGNDTVREAFDEGVARGLWLAAEKARAAIARATGDA